MSKRQKVTGTFTPLACAQVHFHARTRAGRATGGSFGDTKYNNDSEDDDDEEEEQAQDEDQDSRPRRGGETPAQRVNEREIQSIIGKLDEENTLDPKLNMLHELLKLEVEGDAVVGEQSAVKTWLKLAKDASRSLAEGTGAVAVLLELIEDAQGVLKRLLGETPLNVKMKAEHAAVLKVVEQMRGLLLANGFELDAGGKFTSPIDGHTPVAVLYALMVWGIAHGVYELKLLLADCACVPRPAPTPTTARRAPCPP